MIGKSVASGVLKVEALEIIEENLQQSMQNAVVKIYNPDRPLFQDISSTTAQTFWAVLPMAGFGGLSNYYKMKANLPQSTQEKMTKVTEELVKTGVPVEVAETVALKNVVETEQGQSEVIHATETISFMPTNIDSIDPADIKYTDTGITYMHPKLGITFHAPSWLSLQLQIDEWNSLIEEPSNKNVSMKAGQLVYTDGNTGKIITASTWGELAKEITTYQNQVRESTTIESLWDKIVKGSEVHKPQERASTQEVDTTPIPTEFIPPTAIVEPVSPIEKEVPDNIAPIAPVLSKNQQIDLSYKVSKIQGLSESLTNFLQNIDTQKKRLIGKSIFEQEDILNSIKSMEREVSFIQTKMAKLKEEIIAMTEPKKPLPKKPKKAPKVKTPAPTKEKSDGYTWVNVEPANKTILLKWIAKVPESVLGYFTGVELVDQLPDETGKLNPAIEGKYDPKTGRVLLAKTGRKAEVFFHELGHALLTKQLIAGDFSLLQSYGEFTLPYFKGDVQIGTYANIGLDIKSIIMETIKNNEGWNIVKADSWLYNNVDKYKEYQESFAQEFSKHIEGKTTGDSKEFFSKFFPPDIVEETPIIQEEQSYRKIEGCDIMTDEQGRTVICE
jgi:hypothetical protein